MSSNKKGNLDKLENHLVFVDTFAKIESVIPTYDLSKIRISYSGGSDSDTVAWLMKYLGYNVKMVIFDTGLEYKATWRHVEYMRSEGFDIEIVKPEKSIPWTLLNYGKPFISKHVSDKLHRLSTHDFDFKNHGNLSFDELLVHYPNCRSALRWWTDNNTSKSNNISWNRGLKDFLIQEGGVPFVTSSHCCYNAKKLPSKIHARKNKIELLMMGIRRAEGGKRATTYQSCFLPKTMYSYDLYFPIFWWTDKDKQLFDEVLGIKHSECYGTYGMKRTGCPGCPFGQRYEDEINSIAEFDP